MAVCERVLWPLRAGADPGRPHAGRRRYNTRMNRSDLFSAILAIDTSTEFCSVAVCFPLPAADASVVVEEADASAISSDAPQRDAWRSIDDRASGLRFITAEDRTGAVSSTRVLPMIDIVLQAAGLRLQDCVAIAFGAGPGSFTGLRTATGIAQGLAFGADLPVVPVNTLMACAESARLRGTLGDCTRVLAAVDARMAECYAQTFVYATADAEWTAVDAPSVGAPEAALPALAGASATGPYALVGNAVTVFGAAMQAQKEAMCIDVDARPSAVAVASIGWQAWRHGRAVPAADALPEYVRNKVALTTREREQVRDAKLAQQALTTGSAAVGG